MEPGTPSRGVYRRSERGRRERRHCKCEDPSTIRTPREVRQHFGAFLFRQRLLGERRQQVRIRVIFGLHRSQSSTHDMGQFVHDLQLRHFTGISRSYASPVSAVSLSKLSYFHRQPALLLSSYGTLPRTNLAPAGHEDSRLCRGRQSPAPPPPAAGSFPSAPSRQVPAFAMT